MNPYLFCCLKTYGWGPETIETPPKGKLESQLKQTESHVLICVQAVVFFRVPKCSKTGA